MTTTNTSPVVAGMMNIALRIERADDLFFFFFLSFEENTARE